MQVDEMNEHCGLGTWGSNSRCVLASSEDPAGPYTRDLVLIDSWYSARALFLDTRGNVPPVPPSFVLPKIGVIPPLTSTLVRFCNNSHHIFTTKGATVRVLGVIQNQADGYSTIWVC